MTANFNPCETHYLCHIDLNATPYLTHYCVVRADLPFGVQASQLIHAAGYSSTGNLPDGTYAVALHVKDEASLRQLADRLTNAGLPHHLIIEADAPYAGQAMALGIRPCERSLVKPFLSRYKLVSGGLVQTTEQSAAMPKDGAHYISPHQFALVA